MSADMTTQDDLAAGRELDWVAVYNDLHYLLTLERAARDLNLRPALTALLRDLYDTQRRGTSPG